MGKIPEIAVEGREKERGYAARRSLLAQFFACTIKSWRTFWDLARTSFAAFETCVQFVVRNREHSLWYETPTFQVRTKTLSKGFVYRKHFITRTEGATRCKTQIKSRLDRITREVQSRIFIGHWEKTDGDLFLESYPSFSKCSSNRVLPHLKLEAKGCQLSSSHDYGWHITAEGQACNIPYHSHESPEEH